MKTSEENSTAVEDSIDDDNIGQLIEQNKSKANQIVASSRKRDFSISSTTLVEIIGAVALSVGMILAACMVKTSFDAFVDSVASPLDSIAASFRDGIHMRHHFTDKKANQKK
jgi:hypothetical protein